MAEADTPCPHCEEFGHAAMTWSLWGGWFTRFTGWRYCPWCDKTHHPEPDSLGAKSWLIMPVLFAPIALFGLVSLLCCFTSALA